MGSIVVRKTASGHVKYQAYVRKKGVPSRTKTSTSKTRARSWIGRVEAAIEEHRDLPEREAMRRTVANEVEAYLQDEGFAKLSGGEQRKRAMHLRRWSELLGAISVADLTALVIRDARTKLKKTGGRDRPITSATVNRYLASLARFCSYLVGHGLMAENPASSAKVGRGPENKDKGRVLEADERGKLLAACRNESDRLHALAVLALTTGGRRDTELLSLKWSEVDLAERRVSFVKTKTGEPRSLPLPDAAVEVLKGMRDVRHLDGSVFGPDPFPDHAWRRARKAAGLDGLRFHDLRHSYATRLAEAGATLSELKHALGHKTLSMLIKYQHLTERAVEDTIRERLKGVELA